MERKNMVLLTVIAVATLLVAVVGATFAFFTATVKEERTTDSGQGGTNVTAASVASELIVANVDQAAGKFTASDVYPGHKEVAALKVTADNSSGQAASVSDIAIEYDVTTNEFSNDDIQVTVYKSSSAVTIGENYFNCSHSSSAGAASATNLFETCTVNEEAFGSTKLNAKGKAVGTVKLNTGASTLSFTDKISADASDSTTAKYFVVVEFVNGKAAQNTSIGAQLIGNISVELD